MIGKPRIEYASYCPPLPEYDDYVLALAEQIELAMVMEMKLRMEGFNNLLDDEDGYGSF